MELYREAGQEDFNGLIDTSEDAGPSGRIDPENTQAAQSREGARIAVGCYDRAL
jgi:hypothetical protein